MNLLKKTKITATIGPSVIGRLFSLSDLEDPTNQQLVSQAKQNLSDLFDAGVNVIRLNFSHGNYDEQSVKLKLAREVAKEKNLNISFMLDTKGPEIRVYKMKNSSVFVNKGDVITIQCLEKTLGSEKEFSLYDASGTYNMANDVKVNDKIYIDDGKLELIALEVDVKTGVIKALASNTWEVKENKRINLPNANYTIPFMSEKDMGDIEYAVKNNFDYIAASFVNNADNVRTIRELLKKHNAPHIQIISKIETMNAINVIDDIIDASDSIMVARGDLGLEIPYYDVPRYEKYIIKSCRLKGKTVIVATQMLDSLETKLLPTRAEVTDVFFAVERGTDSTMLSGETANGFNPKNAVEVMTNINKSSENFFDYERAINVYFTNSPFFSTKEGKFAKKIASIVAPHRYIDNSDFKYNAVVIFSNEANLALSLSNIRCAAPVFLITDKKEYATKFGLNYGLFVKNVDDLNEAINNKDKVLKQINSMCGIEKDKLVIIDDKVIQQ